MEAIEAVLPAADGLSCFGRTYHDLPVAMVSTCTTLATAPDAAPQLADYQKVDQLLMPDWAVITAELVRRKARCRRESRRGCGRW